MTESYTVTRSTVASMFSFRLNAAALAMNELRKPHAVMSRSTIVDRG